MIDSSSQEVYGHIVASDMFGEAYVIPLEAAFRDMEKKLGMKSVFLPTPRDILAWLHLHPDVSSCLCPQDNPLQNSTDDMEEGICHDLNKFLPLTPVLSRQELKSHQPVNSEDTIEEQRSRLEDIWNVAQEELKVPPRVYHCGASNTPDEPRAPLYHGGTHKTLDEPGTANDTRIKLGNKTLTVLKQKIIRSSVSSLRKIPPKIGGFFKYVPSKLVNVTSRTDKPIPVSELVSWPEQSSSYHVSHCIPGINYEGPGELPGIYESSTDIPVDDGKLEQTHDGNDSGYGSAQSSPAPRIEGLEVGFRTYLRDSDAPV